MDVLYGVCGDGMGHAMRSAVVARYLASRGHSVRFASYGRAFDYLSARWPGRVTRIAGLSAAINGTRVTPEATLLLNAAKQVLSVPQHIASLCEVNSHPTDMVITDFDPWTARYAWLTGLPLLAVDNIHFMNRCSHPRELIVGDLQAAALMYPVVDQVVPNAGHYMVTTFVAAPPCKPATTLHLPILRPEVLAAKRPESRNLLVAYFNDKADHNALAAAFSGAGLPVRLYGEKGRTTTTSNGAVTRCPFSDAAFIADMAHCTAVVGGAGFTFMTEAIYLGKPVLAVPFGGHFEQILNANYLELLGYGERGCDLSADRIRSFLSRVPGYAANLRGFVHDGNAELLTSVEQALGAMARRRVA